MLIKKIEEINQNDIFKSELFKQPFDSLEKPVVSTANINSSRAGQRRLCAETRILPAAQILSTPSYELAEALKKYSINVFDLERGIKNPLEKAKWRDDVNAYKLINKSGLFPPVNNLTINYSSAEEAMMLNYRGNEGAIFRAIRNNDINAVNLMLTLAKKHEKAQTRIIFGKSRLRDTSVDLHNQRTAKLLRSLKYSLDNFGVIPLQSVDGFLKSGTLMLHDLPIIFFDYNIELMEIGLMNSNSGSIKVFHTLNEEWSGGNSPDHFKNIFLKISHLDSDALFLKKSQVIELLKKYNMI